MADTFGALKLPLAPPDVAGGDVAGDPLLTYLLPFLKATLNAYVNDAWQARGVAPARPLVGYTFAHDPGRYGFVDEKLPAIYGWRDSDPENVWMAADWVVDKSVIQLVYIFEPTSNPEVMKVRQAMTNAIRKAIVHAIERERHPSWVVPNDPDNDAATLGSVLADWCGFLELDVGRGRPNKLRVNYGPGKTIDYDTYEIQLAAKERETNDINEFDALAGLDLTQLTPDALTIEHSITQ